MRVLHVIGPLSTGGAQTQLLGLVRAAHGLLWDATVVATSGGALAPHFEALDCEFVELRRRGSPGLLRMRAVRDIVKRGNFDVVHGNLWQSNAYCRTAVLGMTNRPAVVISERNVEVDRSQTRRLVDRLLAPVTDAYIGNTQAVTDFIRHVHPVGDRDVVMLANAVDTSIFQPQATSAERSLRIGSIGRLDPEKGFDVLIDATRALAQDLELSVQIVGEGPLEQHLRNRAQGLPVEFLGRLEPGRPVAEFLRSIDIFVLPSTHREGRPNAVLEAVATKLPVVTTATPGLEELFAVESLVRPNDARELAAAIRSASEDPAGWVERSRPAAVQGFDELAHRYLEVFTRAVSHAR